MSRQVMMLLMVAGMLFALCTQAEATTYYVDATNGDNDANGLTLETPFLTIQKGADTVSAGDTVRILAGTYYESVIMETSGQENQQISFEAYGGGEVIIDPNDSNATYGVLFPSDKDLAYIQIKNITVRNVTKVDESDVGAVSLICATSYPKSNIILENLKIEDSFTGILLRDGVQYSQIKNCTLTGNTHGIWLYKSNQYIEINGNTIDNDYDNAEEKGHGIYLGSPSS